MNGNWMDAAIFDVSLDAATAIAINFHLIINS